MKAKKTVFIVIGGLLAVTIAGFIMWRNLPIEITRYRDIQTGNDAIEKIEGYKTTHGGYPETGDWEILRKIGLKFRGETTWPDYRRIRDSYVLRFLEGFDGPYLTYSSEEKKWKFSN